MTNRILEQDNDKLKTLHHEYTIDNPSLSFQEMVLIVRKAKQRGNIGKIIKSTSRKN